MERKEMIQNFVSRTGQLFITKNELAALMGYKDVKNVSKYLYGLERVEKKYYIPDVVARIKEAATC